MTNGKVFDAETKKVLEGVSLQYLNIKSLDSQNKKQIFLTDSTGFFFMQSDNYGWCPDIKPKIKIWKEGYQALEIIIDERKIQSDLIIKLKLE